MLCAVSEIKSRVTSSESVHTVLPSKDKSIVYGHIHNPVKANCVHLKTELVVKTNATKPLRKHKQLVPIWWKVHCHNVKV